MFLILDRLFILQNCDANSRYRYLILMTVDIMNSYEHSKCTTLNISDEAPTHINFLLLMAYD